jgi:hypothetical protein
VRFAAVLLVVLVPVTALAEPVVRVDEAAEFRLLNRINQAREGQGLAPIERDDTLRQLARFHSADMVQTGFVGLVSPANGSIVGRATTAAGTERIVVRVMSGAAASVPVGASLVTPTAVRGAIGVVCIGELVFVTEISVAVAREAPLAVQAIQAAIQEAIEQQVRRRAAVLTSVSRIF